MFRRDSLATRIISAVLAVGMVWSMSPTSVLAENAVSKNASAPQTETSQVQDATTKKQEKTPATIKLDANGGTGTMEDVQIEDSSDFEQKLAQNVYKRDGYVFSGWSTTADGKDAKNAAGKVVTPAVAVPDGADISNWKFLWDADNDGTADPKTETFDLASCVKDGALTLYALWTRITTTVHFDGNGATSGTMDDEVMPQDSDTALTANAFERDGYKFTGWSTTKDNQSIKDDPATAADESFLATFLGDQVHFLKNVASYDSDGNGTAESFDMNYATKADPDSAANSTITLYAQWEKLPEQNDGKNAADNQDSSSDASADAEQAADDGQNQNASAGQNASDESSAAASEADSKNADAQESDSSDSTDESASDSSTDSSNQSDFVAESDEDHLKNAAPVESTADNDQADVRDADHGGADDLSVKVQDTPSVTSFMQSLGMLFALPAKESAAAPADNPSQDGESIKDLSVQWLTPGTKSLEDSELTVFKPSGNSQQTAKASVYISLDSNKSYKAGSVRLVIPGHIFKTRNDSTTGNLVLPLVENPGTKTEFNWSYDAGQDTYTLTSTRDISGRSEITIEMGFENLVPSDLVDMQASKDFVAKAYVTNSKGNLLTKTSNVIKAAFDTQESLTTAKINQNGQIPWRTKVPANQIPEEKRIPGVKEYLVVTYYTYAYHTGNTAYTLGWDTADQDFGAYDGNNNKVAEGVVIEGGSGIDTAKSWGWDGNTGWHYVKVAYDFSKFAVKTDYTLKAGVKWSLEETDNKSQTSVQPATTEVRFAWHNPEKEAPGGHYAHMNWGDDNDDAYTMHLSINGAQYDYANRSFSHAELLRGYYGIYRTVLNDLKAGTDATVRYQKYLRGYMLPDQLVQGGDTAKKSSFSNPVRMVVEDGDYSFAQNAANPEYQGLTAGVDYEISSVIVCKPTHVYKATEVDASNLQSQDFLYETGSSEPYYYAPGSKVQGGTYGVAYEKTDNLDYYPKTVIEAEVAGQWEQVATVDWKTAASDKVTVKLPEHTERWRATVASNSIAKVGEQCAAVDTQFVCPTVVLHATPAVKKLAAEAIEKMSTPECLLQSEDSFNAYNSSNSVVFNADEKGADHLFGYNSNIMALPSASASKGEWDKTNTKIPLTFTGKVQEQSSVLDKETWEEAVKAGKIKTEKSCTWYDLLPKGVVADLSSIMLRKGDELSDVYTIENFRDSGRTLLVVKAQLAADPVYQDRKGVKYVEDDPSISFNASYSMSSYLDYGQNLHNVVVFESGNETLGNVPNYCGQPDDPRNVSPNDVTVTKDITDEEKRILADLDPDTDKAAFTYADASVSIDGAYRVTNVGLDKQVDVNNEYDYGYGTTDGKKEVYLGGFYRYRLSYLAGEGNFQGLVMYDRLEDPCDGVIGSGKSSWKGKLLSVDTSLLQKMGIKPVVYYSTAPHPQLAQMGSGAEEGTAAPQANLKDTSIWSTKPPQDLSQVTAIAIDCSKKTDGTPFVLRTGQSISATLSMRAPSDASTEARAYNDAYFLSQAEDAGHVQDPKMTHKGHTEVVLKPYKLHVTNKWNDDNDRDGLRPKGTVVLHLMANVKDSESKVVRTFEIAPSDSDGLSPDAGTTFENLPVADASGNPIHYTATLTDEDNHSIPGYTQSVTYKGNDELDLVQNHAPETTSVSGTKTWAGDTEDIRPVAISVNLLANGTQTQSKQITEDASGEWTYSFTNLPKYENHGQPIDYTVSESGADDYALAKPPTSAGYDLVNTYHPYGDLTISKTVTDGTNKTEGQKFTFHLSLTKQDGSEYTDAVSYDKSDGKTVKTGTIGGGSTFELADGESLVLKDLPKGTSWKVTEDSIAGYTADAFEKSGSIKPNADNTAAFTNDYKTSADVSLQATKTLDGRPIQYGQFTFELRNKTDNSLVRTASNDEKGNVSFGAIHYTNADSGKTFTYTITEKDLGHGGYTYDKATYEADVMLADNGHGKMIPTVEYYKLNNGSRDKVDKPSFANTYHATGSVTLTAFKQLKGRDLTDKEFTFDLHAVDVANGTDTIIATAANDASGKIDFTPDAVNEYLKDHSIENAKGLSLSYTQGDCGNTYVYYVTEEKGSDPTVSYDGCHQRFAWTVAVQDDGDGHMSESTTNVDASGLINKDGTVNTDWKAAKTTNLPTFKNKLQNGSLSIEKKAEDRPDGDQTPFTFDVDIQDADGSPLSSDNVEYEISDANSNDSSAGSAAESSNASHTGANPVSTALNSLASLLQPTKAYAAENTDDSDKTWTIIYDANGGQFSGGKTQHEVTYKGQVTGGSSYEEPSGMDGKSFMGWYKDATCTEKVDDPSALGVNATVYAKYEYAHEGTWGTCKWGISVSGTLYIGAGTGHSTWTWGAWGNCPWSKYCSRIKSVKTLGTVVLPSFSSGLFYGCSSLESLDLKGFDTSKVTNMNTMFEGCTSLKSLDLSGIDTSKAMDIHSMFYGCSSLKSLDLSGFDTSKVTRMYYMFAGCSSLESLDLSGFDTSNVTSMNNMFEGCKNLKSLDLSGFDTSNVTSMDNMFEGCSVLKRLVMSDKMRHISTTDLPIIRKTHLYTGKWINIGNSSIKPLSSLELMHIYPRHEAPAGIWEWERTTSLIVSFDKNGGSGSMTNYTSAGDFIAVPDNGFYYPNHVFTGWNTKSDGTGITVQPGDIFDAGSNADSDGRLTLYAQWKESDNKAQVTNGHFTVTIMAGQKITIKNLPGGATYTVHEHNRAGWVLTSAEKATGKIPANDTAKSVFTNTYNPNATSVDISATKTLDGKTPKKDGAYRFTMTADTPGAPMPAGVRRTSTTASNVGSLVDFGHIVFTSPGTYSYTLKEIKGTDSKITYDDHTIKARVYVYDDPTGTGGLRARVTYSRGDAFANTTRPGTLWVKKNVIGTTDKEKSFSFAVTLTDSSHQPLSGTYGDVSVKDGMGTFTLTAGHSNWHVNLPAGTLYQVKETDVPDGYTSSSTGATGTIEAAHTSRAIFTNTYAASATSVYLTAQKTLTGRELQGGDFAFELKNDKGKLVQTATNDADGTIAFEAISFDSAGDYKYYVDEVKPENPDQTITYSNEAYEYDIQVTDNGAGELVAKTDIYAVDPATHEPKGDAVQRASFTNAVKTSSVSLTKHVEGSDAAGVEFVFDVALKDSAGKALDSAYEWTSSRKDSYGNAIKGTVKNGETLSLQKDETVTISDLPVGSTYEFTEVNTKGYTQSKNSNLSGTIEADKTVEASATNTYAATGTAQIKAKKVVLRSGQETAPDADAFMFTLNAKSDENSDSHDEVVPPVRNDGNGDITFRLVYTTADVGKPFVYQIKEYDDGGDRYDFDPNPYLAKVTVADKGDGTLDCKVQYSFDNGETWVDTVPVFRNNTLTRMPVAGAGGFGGLIAAGGVILVLSALAWIRRRRRIQ
ncbi:MAG: BspA family leucine-rich repeat surface protein [Olsenella sp.]|nr:BspA family leucine-rich repeat surface protein [Olsenella sp.]